MPPESPEPVATFHLFFYLTQFLALAGGIFQIWMIIHAATRQNWLWVVLMFFLWLPASLWYFFTVYRNESGSTGFELPGARSRKRIRELKARIHHLDKAHHHLELGDIYFQQGKFKEAEASYRLALARDKEDLDIQSHLGQCLLRQDRAADALPFLHAVCSGNRQHEYGYTLMALAETFTALGRREDAAQVWRQVLKNYHYDRARVQLAELYVALGQKDEALSLLNQVLEEWEHSTAFDRRRNRVWFKKAKSLRGSLA